VYKLVAYDGRPVRKTSTGKEIWPAAKQVWRAPDWSEDTLALADEPPPAPGHRPLLAEVMHDGRRTDAGQPTLAEANDHFEEEWAGLPDALKVLTAPPEHPLTVSSRLRRLAAQLDEHRKSEEEK
jgi:nicotinate phosphoribosyltransferase